MGSRNIVFLGLSADTKDLVKTKVVTETDALRDTGRKRRAESVSSPLSFRLVSIVMG